LKKSFAFSEKLRTLRPSPFSTHTNTPTSTPTHMGNLKKKRRLKMNKHKRRKRSKASRHKKRLWG
jgi:hypothetical protein